MNNKLILDQTEVTVTRSKKPLYSTLSMYLFAILFSPLPLSFMLYQNLSRVGKKQEATLAVVYCIGLFIAMMLLSQIANLGIIVSVLGVSQILKVSLDDAYTIQEKQHPKRNVFGLLLICLAVSGALFYAMVYGI